jgi:hypothetical protein
LPTFALEQLSELAASDVGACTSLERIAFDEEGAAPALRRRACAAFAAVCSTDRLPELSVQLQRESDELLVAGALSALEARIPDPRVDEVLAAHGRTRSEVAIDR